jgi:spore coat polysaccharide biosynthesis protein SpsF
LGRETKADVLIRCDGGAEIGLGHVKRCLAIAENLRRAHSLDILFAGRFDDGAEAVLTAQGFRAVTREEDEASWLAALAARSGARAALFDIRTDLDASALEALRPQMALVTLDDSSPRRLVADLAILPPTSSVEVLEWSGFRGEALIGWAWQVLAAAPAKRPAASDKTGALTLLVTMGGADPLGLTARAAKLLMPLADCLQPIFVIGPAFAQPVALRTELRLLWPKAEIALRPETLAPLMARADLALVAYGVTAQELAASGVPALYLGLTADHVHSAETLAATGAGLCLGLAGALSDAALREAVAALIGDAGRRKAMAAAGPKAIDGRGAERLAVRIADLIRIRTIAGAPSAAPPQR